MFLHSHDRRSFGAAMLLGVAAVAVRQDGAPTAQTPESPPSAQQPSADLSAVKTATDERTPAEPEAKHAKLRFREGTRLRDIRGRFRPNGDTLTFIDEQKREIGGLPNLNLERIIRMLKTVEEPESIIWSVSGTITEFSGRNYLLISRAVYKAATPPPSPEALAQ